MVGFLGGLETRLPIVPLIEGILRIQGIAVGSRERFEAMARAIDATGIKPVIDRTLTLDQTAQALPLMERGGHLGKICIALS